MNKPKIANYQARGYVEEHRPFIANNIFAEWTDDDSRYVVYSYGKHWPLFIWDAQTQRWYANVSKYSVTTSKHRSTTHPHIPKQHHDVPACRGHDQSGRRWHNSHLFNNKL